MPFSLRSAQNNLHTAMGGDYVVKLELDCPDDMAERFDDGVWRHLVIPARHGVIGVHDEQSLVARTRSATIVTRLLRIPGAECWRATDGVRYEVAFDPKHFALAAAIMHARRQPAAPAPDCAAALSETV
jgi:hypothetical protein